MFTASIQRSVHAAEISPDQLAGNPKLSEREKIAELSKRFEAILVRQILTEANKPVFKSSMALGTAGAAIHQDMLTNEMANRITSSGGLGLARQLTRDLSKQLKPEASEADCEAHATLAAKPLFHQEPVGSTSLPRWKR